MVKIENSKRTILNLAESLLQDRGFNGFSYADIASALNVKNAAIHYHFPSKEALAIAVIQRYRERFKLWINNARIKDLAPQEKLNWFFKIYEDFRVNNGKVCLVGALEVEFNTIPDGLKKEVESLNRETLAWLEVTLAEGKKHGAFQFNGTPASKAALIYSSVQGSLQMARALGAKKFREVVEQNKMDVLAA
ncbi:MAG: TetR/AcrR family transcriptional regulator [Anaerolineales bacterium]|nr:TetR/AcrR family transcriptional regulator [Anaerolineales bacterium]